MNSILQRYFSQISTFCLMPSVAIPELVAKLVKFCFFGRQLNLVECIRFRGGGGGTQLFFQVGVCGPDFQSVGLTN